MSTFIKIIFFSFLIISLTNCQSETNTDKQTSTPTNEEQSVETNVPKTPAQLLQGRWVNVASESEFLIFNGTNMVRRFAGATPQEDKLTNKPFSFFEKCHPPCQIQSTEPDVSKFKCFTLKEDGAYNCYKVTILDEETLEYTLMDGTGPTYGYKKVK